jgi:phosphatidylcholine synthase
MSDRIRRITAWAVHTYTASGVVFAFLAAIEVAGPVPSARRVFLWLIVAVLIDATDGPLARLAGVKIWLPELSGRKIDDIVDYLTYTFVPLLLIWRMNWLAGPAAVWIAFAMVTSLFGFANEDAKQEQAGFFRGFPSYWNIFAFYAGICTHRLGPVPTTVFLILLALLTVLPVRFLYPNLAPRGWRPALLIGAYVWFLLLVLMLGSYPEVSIWILGLSFVFPIFYIIASLHLSVRLGRSGA